VSTVLESGPVCLAVPRRQVNIQSSDRQHSSGGGLPLDYPGETLLTMAARGIVTTASGQVATFTHGYYYQLACCDLAG